MTVYDPGRHPAIGKDFLCLHRNENLFAERLWTEAAIRESLASVDVSTYPDPACTELRHRLADLYSTTPDRLYVGNGADGVLADLAVSQRRRFDTLGTLDVGFGVYALLARRFGYRLERFAGDTFRTGRIEARGWRGLALIDSPNSITAARTDAHQIRKLSRSPDAFVVWDNVYGEFAGDTVIDGADQSLAMVRSFSKFYALAGVRVGYCIAHEEIVRQLMELKHPFAVNVVGQRMALAALNRRSEFEEVARQILACREGLCAELDRLGFSIDHPSATHFVLVRHRSVDAATLERELRSEKILVRRFPGPPVEDYLRITVPPSTAIGRLCEALDGICSRHGGG